MQYHFVVGMDHELYFIKQKTVDTIQRRKLGSDPLLGRLVR
jgi:hypothetical protein